MAGADAYVQWAVETLATGPGAENRSPALSSTVFYSPAAEFSWHLPAVMQDRSPETRGRSDNLAPDVVGFDATDASVQMNLYPNFLGLLLTLTHGAPTTTQGDGSTVTDPDSVAIPASAYRHVWTAGTTNTAVRTAQLQLGYTDQTAYFKMKGVTCTELGLSMDGEEAKINASLSGLYTAKQANPSLTPSYDAATIKPFIRAHQTINTWLAASGATTNATALGLKLTNPVDSVKTLSGSKYPDNWDRTGADLVLSAELALRDIDTDDWDAFVAGTNWTVLTKLVHSQFITGSYPYKLYFQGNAVYTDAQADPLMHKVRHGMQLPVTFGYDAGVGYSYKITLVNGVSSYSSVG